MLGVRFRDRLPTVVVDEFDALVATIRALFEAEHDADDGTHTDITCSSLAGKSDDLPITANLQLLKGGLYLDDIGNSTHRAGLRPPLWTTAQNNYKPDGITTALAVECDTNADYDITGIARVARRKRLLLFGNRGNYTITLKHNNAGSDEVNRFGLPHNADLAIGSSCYIWLYYDVGSEIWRAIGVL